jgi:hypothetical protein
MGISEISSRNKSTGLNCWNLHAMTDILLIHIFGTLTGNTLRKFYLNPELIHCMKQCMSLCVHVCMGMASQNALEGNSHHHIQKEWEPHPASTSNPFL